MWRGGKGGVERTVQTNWLFLENLTKKLGESFTGKTEEKEIKQTQEMVDNEPKISIDDYVFKPNNDDNKQSRGMKF